MQQARVQLPAVALQVEASKVLSDAALPDAMSQALQGGCNMIVLWDSNANAASMYDAALRIQDLLRGRAALLLVDRTDIALAVGAQGVLLTNQALVGRVVSDEGAAITAAADGANLVLVTVGSNVHGPGGGAPPSAAVLEASKSGQRSGNAIPLLMSVRATGAGSGVEEALEADIDGVAVSPEALPEVARCCFDLPETSSIIDYTTAILTRLNVKAATAGTAKRPKQQKQQQQAEDQAAAAEPATAQSRQAHASTAAAAAAAPAVVAPPPRQPVPAISPAAPSAPRSPSSPAPLSSRPLRRLLDPERETLLLDEKATLAEALSFLEETLPGVSELSLLRDALKALDEPFLVAVVGEFNSGKSSVINALLGRRYLAEGILPTTNEISILKYSATAGATAATAQLEQQADGLYVRYLPAKLLQDLSIVDTPGTNVILERQQRLTEEYVPRADLVLFVMSADRPFSESEVRFLEYIRQWQKKVVFVVNKADILDSVDEVEAVKEFVARNAQRILRLDRPTVIAVSSRAALRAKLAAAGLSFTSSLDADGPFSSAAGEAASLEAESLDAALPSSPDWRSSNFAELERQVSNFLVGRGAGGGEGVRLKLQTPLFVADALLGAAGRQLAVDLAAARAELEGLQLVSKQLTKFRSEMEKDATAQRAALQQVLSGVLSRAERFVDQTVQLSNAPLLVSIAAGNKEYPFRAAFEKEVIGNGFDSLRAAVSEHSSWLRANCDAQREYYASFAAARGEAAGVVTIAPSAASSNGTAAAAAAGVAADRTHSNAEASTFTSTPLAVSATAITAASSGPSASSPALLAVSEFNVRAISTLLDTELQQAMATTVGTAAGAPLFGLFAMQLIPNTLEDILLAGLSGAVSYVSLLNLPLRRADLKGKISRVASNFVSDVQSKMEVEVADEVAGVMRAVAKLMEPLEQAYGTEVARLEARQADLARLADGLKDLQRRVANLE
ncbi:hypothetical protein VOLCADRAFT_120148 [Volvox carteri f. nagariensis]|uniref:G domain-containing protein n=1 Tax=Volvox carteri f. nagariensis TaxID=3068 RepID=D8TH71_VOLCA|nr:uncharacterized protein VOLCADRAFT_120148 [Volvox carteri f. nagariensis]EFJ53019.1 hypothetical protein VOLCADRAFT_120148 [Volvox carteri f. nagariensis]|eukprot:XP_002946024.1 hypothetical protein VOLCADRAFT_120148 [Volvox carteri f. nagariensis]